MANREQGRPGAGDQSTSPPPKILDQFMAGGQDVEPETGLPPPEPPPHHGSPPSRGSQGRQKTLIALSIVALALILVLAAIVVLVGRNLAARKAAVADQPEEKSAEVVVSIPDGDRIVPRISPPSPFGVPATASEVVARKEALARIDQYLEDEINADNAGLRPYVAKAGLAIVDPVFGLKDADLQSLPAGERKLLETYRDTLNQLGRNLGSKGDRESDISYLENAMDDAAERLAERRPMEITKVVLCRGVNGFGKYEVFADNDFNVRHLPLVQVYTEIENLKHEVRPDGRFVYRLSEEIRLLRNTSSGDDVVMDATVSITDVTSSRKTDFYTSQYLRPPREVAAGEYRLEVIINDQVGGQKSRTSVPLRISSN